MNNSHSQPQISRRRLLQGGSIFAAGAVLSSRSSNYAAQAQESNTNTALPLHFNSDGRFKIVQFNDTQDDHMTDKRTIEFMSKVLDQEKPDFALINGDVITDGPTNPKQVYQAINNVVLPMEQRNIPWAITYGNHDEDSVKEANTGVYEKHMSQFVRSYRHNLNPEATDRPFGHSDAQLLIGSAKNKDNAAFAIWLLDSGNYLPENDSVQDNDELPHYDYIRPEQIKWYRELSLATEKRFGKKIPSLMYFHIPTYEHRDMWFGGPANHSDSKHKDATKRHKISGVKNEDVCYGSFNSGIYGAVRERGDVLGIYCGHDHINSYYGDYFGVELGYCPGTGFAPYGLHDGTILQHTLRGARVFELNENSDRIYETTRLIFAKDLGLDMQPAKQPIAQPAELPEYVKMPS
ncbi:phosphoesterase [Corynebacterium sp. sy017]|uniref:metallophosphoesterase family protein n=1 Tax=unclassified Corynebacterium TaxID=2624378 RepID=UPI001185A125|nr:MULTISPECIES: metallophosphoesterase family protein [unclassified Corynebacterium]MBP3088353.1 phosphoesterase [Corynebacterium sp. sy017]TSD91669.1 phosphoesterase [Corynebacterium sp. SY003]